MEIIQIENYSQNGNVYIISDWNDEATMDNMIKIVIDDSSPLHFGVGRKKEVIINRRELQAELLYLENNPKEIEKLGASRQREARQEKRKIEIIAQENIRKGDKIKTHVDLIN